MRFLLQLMQRRFSWRMCSPCHLVLLWKQETRGHPYLQQQWFLFSSDQRVASQNVGKSKLCSGLGSALFVLSPCALPSNVAALYLMVTASVINPKACSYAVTAEIQLYIQPGSSYESPGLPLSLSHQFKHYDSAGKESACNAGDLGLIPGLGRSPGEGKGYPLQHSGLENSMDCIVHGVMESCTRLSTFHFHFKHLSSPLRALQWWEIL